MPATLAKHLTTEELLTIPDDGVDRWLVRGELREKPSEFRSLGMTVRNRFHSRIMMRLAQLLNNWFDGQPTPRGEVLGGEAGVRVSRDPDTTFGIDLVYVSVDVAQNQPNDTTLIDGVPVLAIEILSPSDTVEEIDEKVDDYLAAGVPLVWIVNPHRRTVLIHRPGAEPQLATVGQEIANEPNLPGLRIAVARIFE